MGADQRGGGYRYITKHPGAIDLENERDIALASDAYRRARRASCGAHANGDAKARIYSEAMLAFRGILRFLHANRLSVMTQRQRAWAMKILGLVELPPIGKTKLPPETQVLPLKPPGRK